MMNEAKEFLIESELSNTFWGEIIIEAEAEGSFSEEYAEMAASWFSCACGKLDSHIERESDGAPSDRALLRYGITFSNSVDCDAFLSAAITLDMIEQRSIELLKGDIL